MRVDDGRTPAILPHLGWEWVGAGLMRVGGRTPEFLSYLGWKGGRGAGVVRAGGKTPHSFSPSWTGSEKGGAGLVLRTAEFLSPLEAEWGRGGVGRVDVGERSVCVCVCGGGGSTELIPTPFLSLLGNGDPRTTETTSFLDPSASVSVGDTRV